MHKITIHEVNIPAGSYEHASFPELPIAGEPAPDPYGLIATIEPALKVVPDRDLIESFLLFGTPEFPERFDPDNTDGQFDDGVITFKTDRRTDFFVTPFDISRIAIEEDKPILAERTQALLGHLGVGAEIVY